MKFFPFDRLFGLSKLFPELNSQYWRDYVDKRPERVSASTRMHQLFLANHLFGLYESRKKTSMSLITDLEKIFRMRRSPSPYELLIRAIVKIETQRPGRQDVKAGERKERRGRRNLHEEKAPIARAIAANILKEQPGLSDPKLGKIVFEELRKLAIEAAGERGKDLLVHSEHSVQRLLKPQKSKIRRPVQG